MNPRNLYFLKSNSRLFAYQGYKQNCVLGFLRLKDANNIASFIYDRNIQIRQKKGQNYMYSLIRSKEKLISPREIEIVQYEPEEALIEFITNNVKYDIIDQITPKNNVIVNLYSNYTFSEYDISDNDIYREKLETIYNNEEFDLYKYLSNEFDDNIDND